jgi:hypothetical protein
LPGREERFVLRTGLSSGRLSSLAAQLQLPDLKLFYVS